MSVTANDEARGGLWCDFLFWMDGQTRSEIILE